MPVVLASAFSYCYLCRSMNELPKRFHVTIRHNEAHPGATLRIYRIEKDGDTYMQLPIDLRMLDTTFAKEGEWMETVSSNLSKMLNDE